MPRTQPPQKPGRSQQDYRTPETLLQAVLRLLDRTAFAFDFAAGVDPITRVCNSVAPEYWDTSTNSLQQSAAQWATCTPPGQWGWCNPPFGHIRPWAHLWWTMSTVAQGRVVALIPAAVGSTWWRDFVHEKAHVRFLLGRPAFIPERPTWGYPKDIALLVYGDWNRFTPGYRMWDWRQDGGAVHD